MTEPAYVVRPTMVDRRVHVLSPAGEPVARGLVTAEGAPDGVPSVCVLRDGGAHCWSPLARAVLADVPGVTGRA